jgi:hypothetical protein
MTKIIWIPFASLVLLHQLLGISIAKQKTRIYLVQEEQFAFAFGPGRPDEGS